MAPHSKGETYLAYITVSMSTSKTNFAGSDRGGGSPEVAQADREEKEARDALYPLYKSWSDANGVNRDSLDKKLDEGLKRIEQAEAKRKAAYGRVVQDLEEGRPPKEPIKDACFVMEWKYYLQLVGALDNFAEDERNSLDKMVDCFAEEFLKANPAPPKQ
jgi:hypothetical protein